MTSLLETPDTIRFIYKVYCRLDKYVNFQFGISWQLTTFTLSVFCLILPSPCVLSSVLCCLIHLSWSGDHPRVTLHQCYSSSNEALMPASDWSVTPHTGLSLAESPRHREGYQSFVNIARHSGEQIVSNKWLCAMFLFCETPHSSGLLCHWVRTNQRSVLRLLTNEKGAFV